MTVRLLSGSVLASAVVLDPAFVGEDEARRRALALAPARVHRARGQLVVLLRAPRRLRTSEAPGTLLVATDGVLSAVAPPPSGLAGSSVALLVGGEVVVTRLDENDVEDPAGWLDVADFEVDAGAEPLGAPKLAVAAVTPPAQSVRELLQMPPPEAAAIELARAIAGRGGGEPGLLRSLLRAALGAAARVVATMSSITARLGLAGGAAGALPASTSSSRRGVELAVEPPPPGFLSRLWSRLEGWARNTLAESRFGALLARAHARYLSRMLALFESNLDEALRHAIPLGGEGGASSPALAPPGPRRDLAIRPGRAGSTTSIGGGPSLHALLTKVYRDAFQRLVARGEIDKAAFVLAELLHADLEAVSFLERHGRLRLAAELAEARKLPPGVVVRQWLLAGDRRRAIAIARRHDAFADALRRLEGVSAHADAAMTLRALWADHLASSGAYAAAVDVAWARPETRALAARWIELAIAIGGVTGARMLVKKLELLPARWEEVHATAGPILEDEREDAVPVRRAYAEALAAATRTEASALLGVQAVRAFLPAASAAEARSEEVLDRPLLERLLALASDPVLRADVAPALGLTTAATMPWLLRAGAATHVGTARDRNEDHVIALALEKGPAHGQALLRGAGVQADDGIVAAVFDGTAQRAAELAADVLVAQLRARRSSATLEPAVWAEALRAALEVTSTRLYEESRAKPGHAATATVASVAWNELLVAHVGNGRAILVRDGKLVRITRDHTLLEELRASGQIPEGADLSAYPHHNVITRVLGGAPELRVDVFRLALEPGDRVLLLSDGVHGALSDTSILATVRRSRSAGPLAEALVEDALRLRTQDDVSAVVLEVVPPRGARPYRVAEPRVVPVEPATSRRGPSPLFSRREPLALRRAAEDVGAVEVRDAVVLPDGKILLALGELGARLVDRAGHTLYAVDEPVDALVVSDHGDRAIGVSARGDARRLVRIDVAGRRAEPWCDAHFGAFARDFDGMSWWVAHEDALLEIDALSEDFAHLGALRDERARFGALTRAPGRLVARVVTGDAAWAWTWDTKSRALRERRPLTSPAVVFGEDQEIVSLLAGPEIEPIVRVERAGAVLTTRALGPDVPGRIDVFGKPGWAALSYAGKEGVTVRLGDLATLTDRLVIELAGAGAVSVRAAGMRLVIADDRGRVLVVSLRSGALLSDLRIR